MRGGRACAFVLALLALGAPAAVAGPVPDEARLAALQAASDSAWRTRVVSGRATYLLERPAFGAEGVNVAPRLSGPPALVTIGTPPENAKWIPWSEIDQLDTGKNVAGRSAFRGLVVGAVVGGLLVATLGPDLSDANDNAITIFAVLLAAGGAAGGYMVGLANPSLTRVYP